MAASPYDEILYDVTDPVATIKLNRPKQLNAWTNRMGAEVKHAFAAAEADERVVVIVLTGEGRGFCAGADLNGLQDISDGRGNGERIEGLEAEPGDPSMDESFHGHYSFPMSIRKPVIAAINGPCAGMALPISLCCDLRFAAENATFTTAFAHRGLVAEWGVSWTLARLAGHAVALDLLLSGRKFDGAEAAQLGLVNRALPAEELMPFVRQYAEDMAARSSPTSMAIMKRQIYEDLTESLAHANKKSLGLMLESFERPDFKEGVRSFLERRPARFQRLQR